MTRSSGQAIALRGALALFAGYAVTAIWTGVLARALPLPPLDASLIATMLSFALFAAIAIWSFAARRIGRLAIRLLIVAAIGVALFRALGA